MTNEQFEADFEATVRSLYKVIQKSGVTLSFQKIQEMLWEDVAAGGSSKMVTPFMPSFNQLSTDQQVIYCLTRPIIVKPKR